MRSKPPELIRRELEGLLGPGLPGGGAGGIDLPSYGRDLGLGFLDGVRAACQAPGISRVRLGSLEPDLLSARDLDELAALPAFCPQFHLSLQSGSDGVLRRMNRHYTAAEYLGLVRLIQQKFPAGAVTTDMMVGFPGETEEEFLQSLEFVRQAGFARVHVFAYSPRPGTPAAARPDQIPPPVKEERSRRMAEAAAEMRSAFLLRQVGSRQRVLFERYRPGAGAPGYTPNYTPVLVETPDDLRGWNICRAVRRFRRRMHRQNHRIRAIRSKRLGKRRTRWQYLEFSWRKSRLRCGGGVRAGGCENSASNGWHRGDPRDQPL